MLYINRKILKIISKARKLYFQTNIFFNSTPFFIVYIICKIKIARFKLLHIRPTWIFKISRHILMTNLNHFRKYGSTELNSNILLFRRHEENPPSECKVKFQGMNINNWKASVVCFPQFYVSLRAYLLTYNQLFLCFKINIWVRCFG